MFPPPTVLCIDDDVLLLAIRKALLESNDFRVFTAENGPIGLEIANREHIEIVILDYQMPGMDGGTVAKELRRIRPDLAILLSSGLREIPESLLAIVDGFVPKGSSFDDLKKEIARVTVVRKRPFEQISQKDSEMTKHIEHFRGFVSSKQLPPFRRKRAR